MEYLKAHYLEIWAIIATVLFMLSEMLGWTAKFKSSAVGEFVWNLIKKGAGKEEKPVEPKVEEKK